MKSIQVLAIIGLGVGAFLLLKNRSKKQNSALLYPAQYAPVWSDNITGNNGVNNDGIIYV